MKSLARDGLIIEKVSLPTVAMGVEAANIVAMVEANAYHQSAGYFPGAPRSTAKMCARELRLAARCWRRSLSRRKIRLLWRARSLARRLQRVDAIVLPSTAIAAPTIGGERVDVGGTEESVRSALVRLNRPANFTGLPAISVPCGFTKDGLPVGLELIGRAFDEATLLEIAGRYEREHKWHLAHPRLDA